MSKQFLSNAPYVDTNDGNFSFQASIFSQHKFITSYRYCLNFKFRCKLYSDVIIGCTVLKIKKNKRHQYRNCPLLNPWVWKDLFNFYKLITAYKTHFCFSNMLLITHHFWASASYFSNFSNQSSYSFRTLFRYETL